MGVKPEWRASGNGPDVLDAGSMMQALGAVHDCQVELHVQPGGIGFATGVGVRVTAYFVVLPGSELPDEVDVISQWPNKEDRTFWGEVYDMLYRLDYKIGTVYRSKPLW